MCKAAVKGGLIGGIVIFIWSAISWMFLPWHMMTIHSFKNEAAVTQAIQANVPTSGVYLMPMMTEHATTTTPMVFAAVRLAGMPTSMVPAMIIALIIQIVAAFLVTWLLTKAVELKYFGRLWFVCVFGIASAVVAYLPYWNWFGFCTDYTLVGMADLIIGWILAGFFIAFMTRR